MILRRQLWTAGFRSESEALAAPSVVKLVSLRKRFQKENHEGLPFTTFNLNEGRKQFTSYVLESMQDAIMTDGEYGLNLLLFPNVSRFEFEQAVKSSKTLEKIRTTPNEKKSYQSPSGSFSVAELRAKPLNSISPFGLENIRAQFQSAENAHLKSVPIVPSTIHVSVPEFKSVPGQKIFPDVPIRESKVETPPVEQSFEKKDELDRSKSCMDIDLSVNKRKFDERKSDSKSVKMPTFAPVNAPFVSPLTNSITKSSSVIRTSASGTKLLKNSAQCQVRSFFDAWAEACPEMKPTESETPAKPEKPFIFGEPISDSD
jgi:hypothetical protein